MYALVQDAGRDVDYEGEAVWPPGLHYANPFPCCQRRISHLVTKQSIVFDTPIRGCKTMDDVTVTIDICVVFRIMGDKAKNENPNLVRTFVYELGPSELARQLKDAQDERVRALARSVRHTEVYSLRSHGKHMGGDTKIDVDSKTTDDDDAAADTKESGVEMTKLGDENTLADEEDSQHRQTNEKAMQYTDQMKLKLNKQFNKYGVMIIDVAIQRVSLPDKFQQQMEDRTTSLTRDAEQKQKQVIDLQRVKQREEIETLNQKFKEQQQLEKKQGEREAAKIDKKLQTIEAETKKLCVKIKENGEARLMDVRAKADLQVQQSDSEAKRVLEEWDAKTSAEVQRLVSDCDAFIWEKSSDAKLVEAQCSAKGNKVISDAEGKSAQSLQAKRKYELQKKQIAMYSALADNKNVVISGTNSGGQGLLADLVMSQKQSNILLNLNTEGKMT